MSSTAPDVAIVGGGIVGLATARAILLGTRASVVVLEAEEQLAQHQSSHNSGVIHSGLYYRPRSLKAVNCLAGREKLYRFCEEHEVEHERCGKLVVAVTEQQVRHLMLLEERGQANGLDGLRRLSAAELKEYEPHVGGVAGLQVPQTGIVDFSRVAAAMADECRARGAEVRTGWRLRGVRRLAGRLLLNTTRGSMEAHNLINCAGLQSDRVARMCGLEPPVRIIPIRGEYYRLRENRRHLVRNPIYPVPDSRLPFLGVHFTRTLQGRVEIGPNAVLALSRSGYERWTFSPRDTLESLSYGGFVRMIARHWRVGLDELLRSISLRRFVGELRKLVPELCVSDMERHGAGIRAQAVRPDGSLVDDFVFVEAERMLHVLSAPSPAATASLSIGESLAGRSVQLFGLSRR